jgi:acyl-CoA hydrolase
MGVQAANRAPRRISADEAAALVRPGMWLDFGITHGQPDVFDAALARRIHELHDVKIRSCLTLRPRACVEADPCGERVRWFSWHFSGYDRAKHDGGNCTYLPLNLGEVTDYYRRFLDPVDIAVIKARPMDADGWFNFGPTSLWHRAVIDAARMVIIEVTDNLPHAYGPQNGVHVSEVDYLIDGDGAALPELPNHAPTEIDQAVARLIAQEVEDGACLQIGIGGMPNAVCALIKEAGVRDLGIHTEMLTDGLMDLYQSGLVTGARKKIDVGKLVYSFALGSRELYQATDRNPDMLCCPVEHTNLPHIIMQNPKVVSINSTTQVDLQGQAASESDGHRHISGTGGQLQFVRGAYASEGGKTFLCLPSTYDKRGARRSRIVLDLTPGNIVTTPRTDAMYIVTEYGMTNLKGKSVCERAKALISLAHPDFREELERQAYEHRLLPRAVAVAAL